MKNLKKGDTLKLKAKNQRGNDFIEGIIVDKKTYGKAEVLIIDTAKIAGGTYFLDMYEIIKN